MYSIYDRIYYKFYYIFSYYHQIYLQISSYSIFSLSLSLFILFLFRTNTNISNLSFFIRVYLPQLFWISCQNEHFQCVILSNFICSRCCVCVCISNVICNLWKREGRNEKEKNIMIIYWYWLNIEEFANATCQYMFN